MNIVDTVNKLDCDWVRVSHVISVLRYHWCMDCINPTLNTYHIVFILFCPRHSLQVLSAQIILWICCIGTDGFRVGRIGR